MRIIDLLNKIANGEELPKKVKLHKSILELNEDKNNYLYEENDEYWGDELIHWFALNDEVEIIEEDKKIEKWNYDKDCTNEWNFQEIKEKLDEIIDELNKE